MHHKLDIHSIPEEMLYVNDPSLAVKVPYETGRRDGESSHWKEKV